MNVKKQPSVLGDVFCCGFAMRVRDGKALEIYIVASGDKSI